MSEFSRPLRLDQISAAPRPHRIAADVAERAALAQRFDLAALDTLEAALTVRLERGAVHVAGEVRGAGAQRCVLTGAPAPFALVEPLAVRFLPRLALGEEVELDPQALDDLPLEGGAVDLGELVAQTLALALPAYPRAPGARAAPGLLISEEEAAERAAREREAASPFAGLAGRD